MEKSVEAEALDMLTAGNMSEHEVSSRYSALSLAFIGDSIYDLKVKTFFVKRSNAKVESYHKKVSSVVSADSQSRFIESILDELREDELAVYKRARNSSPHTKAKNATLGDYLKATGFEALLGYLYLSGQSERLDELVVRSLQFHEVI